ncbi:hypothetical protein HPB51_007226 [Rhipicephalus microplus]|uniref:Uncharacterized protein n=1 Tax=Rhipicephalus microplus TaxID=6941 RepID=A0A9J6E042_RHIMP|nr:hypothetical protein HPB51_007226 [Rhipicephalus microplus]
MQPSPRGSPAKVPLCSRFSPETHQKKPSVEPSPRGSPEKEPTRPAFTMKLHRNKSTESSPRGSPVRKVYYADNESGMSENHSRGGSPQRKSEKRAPSPRSSPKCSGRSSPTTDKSRQKRQPEERSVDEAHTDTDSPLLAKIRVGFPGARRTQRRWSRTEMHRSTSYDTAASSLAPSSTKEKRAHSAGQFPSAKPSRAHKKTSVETISEDPPASWWQSMCNIFGGAEPQPATAKAVGTKKSCCDSVCDLCRSWCSDEPKPRKKSSPRRRSSAGFPSPQPVLPPPPPPPVLPLPPVNPPQRSGYPPMPPKPEFRRRQGSSEDVATEKNKPVETKPSTGGSILSNIFNWFSSRSGEKQDETKVEDVGSGIQGSSFQQWLAAKECALKQDVNKHSGELIGLAGKGSPERHNAGSHDSSRKRSQERLPSQEASPVPRELYFEEEGGPRWVIKYSPSPSVTPGQPAVDGPRLHKSTRSRERTPPVLGTQRPPGAAETDWSVQYLYGPGGYKQGSPAPSGSRSPMRMPAPPPSLAIRFQGMHGQHGTGEAMTTTNFGGPSPRGFNNVPDFSIRIKQGRERSSSSRASIRSKGPGRETSPAGSKEEPSLILRLVQPRSRSRGSWIQSQEHSNGPEKKKSEVTFKDKVETKVIASPPTEPPVGNPAKTEHPPPADTATAPPAPPPITPRILRTEETFKHEFFEEMDERGKAATMAPAVRSRRWSIHGGDSSVEEKKRSHARSSKEKPAQMPPDQVGEAQTPALLTSHSDPAGKKAHKPPKSSESPKPSAGGKKASLSPGEPAHTNYVLEMKRHREHVPYWSDPLSYKCPTVQEVAGYAIITAVLLLGLVLLVSVPRLRSQVKLNSQRCSHIHSFARRTSWSCLACFAAATLPVPVQLLFLLFRHH